MTKRELIQLLEDSPLPDNSQVRLDVSYYDEDEELTSAVAITEAVEHDGEMWLVAADERWTNG